MKTTLKFKQLILGYFTRVLLISNFLFVFLSLKAQGPPFESYYGSRTSGNDQLSYEFVTCASIDPDNYSYAGIHSFLDSSVSSPMWTIRGVRVKSDGTMFTNNFDVIQESSNLKHIFPLKIIPFVDNNGQDRYLITGYISDISTPGTPYPFALQADNNLAAIDFKVFIDHQGFFTDVDQLSNGDLVFAGSATSDLTIASRTRLGWILRTDNNNFTTQWLRYTHNYNHSSSNYRQDFDIISDVNIIDDDSAIVCGNVSDELSCVNPGFTDSSGSHTFIAKINLNDGSSYWQTAVHIKFLAARLALNSAATQIALASNSIQPYSASITLFDRGGNYILSNSILATPLSSVPFRFIGNDVTPNADIILEQPFIQNIYYNNNDEDIFISGKFIKAEVNIGGGGGIIDRFEMPFSVVYDASADDFGTTLNLFKSSQRFQTGVSNFITYDKWYNVCAGTWHTPLISASNTLRCLSNCGTDEYVTISLDVAKDANSNLIGNNKVWIFTNDNSLCHFEPVTPSKNNPNQVNTTIYNDYILAVPEILDFDFTNTNPSKNNHSCDE